MFKPHFSIISPEDNYSYELLVQLVNDCIFRQAIFSKNVNPQSLEKLIHVKFVHAGFQEKVAFYSDISLLNIQVKVPIYV